MGIAEQIIGIIAEEASRSVLARFDRVEDKLINIGEEFKMLFSEYQAQQEAGFDAILVAINAEGEELNALVQAALEGDRAEIQAASIRAAEKRRDIVDAIAGLSTRLQSPTAPTPLPEPTPEEPVPAPPAPEPIPEPPAPPVVDPEVPVEVTPSPDGTGVDGGIEVTPVEVPVVEEPPVSPG